MGLISILFLIILVVPFVFGYVRSLFQPYPQEFPVERKYTDEELNKLDE